ncbi:hypothetical protein CC78DRAFT_597972 [Lojkania enalia]|uniref:Heterokaryon incompatibility domain-containing protein n=1 Tax=Lojkania enalia TaxID=147567 RepID=A0A9P4N775_9PLEO|nr:hypothetical protein CC78DRAFT_597972 [Didymosphaeria enalia]
MDLDASIYTSVRALATTKIRPGKRLVILASKGYGQAQRCLFGYEKRIIKECFVKGSAGPDFASFYVEAVCIAAKDKHFELVSILLGYDGTRILLKHQSTLLQAILSIGLPNERYEGKETQSMVDTVRLLIKHGAPVNTRDEQGKTALYYACVRGFSGTFALLTAAGANFTVSHDVQSFHSEDDDPTYVPEVMREANLLQISLDAWYFRGYCTTTHIWVDLLSQRWGDVILFLLRKGLEIPPHEPALVALFHVACYQGDINIVSKLLSHGVNIHSTATFWMRRDRYYSGSALHAAASGGQKPMTMLLFASGADAQSRVTHTGENGDGLYSPIEAALNPRRTRPELLRGSRLNETCFLLVEAGASGEFAETVLRQCAYFGNVEVAKQLTNLGYRTREPLIYSKNGQALFEYLLESSSVQGDPSTLQKSAIKSRSIYSFRLLVQRYGPLLSIDSIGEMYTDIFNEVEDGNTALLEYLFTDYGLNVNEVFDHSEGRSTFLKLACGGEHGPYISSTRLLLELGADIRCSELGETAYGFLYERFQSRTRRLHMILPVLRLLFAYDCQEPGTECDRRALVADRLPSRLHEGIEDVIKDDDSRISVINPHRESSTSHDSVPVEGPNLQYYSGLSRDEFTYQPLMDIQSLRLLRVEPSNSLERHIECHILHTTLYDTPEFFILSYIRDRTDVTVPIRVNDTLKLISSHVDMALRRVRHVGKPIHVWADGLCVDHANVNEKNQQFSMLRDIFEASSGLLVYLGEEDEGSHSVFEWIKHWKAARGFEAANTRPMISEEQRQQRRKIQASARQPSESVKTAYANLMNRPWFSQVWSLLEIRTCPRMTAICGSDTEDLRALLGSREFKDNNRLSRSINRYRWTPLYREGHLQNNDLNELYYVIQYIIHCRAIDPRDKIFSFLGLCKAEYVEIDYNQEVSKVYRQFTQRVFEETKRLEMLHHFGVSQKRSECLASWVPDYSLSSKSFRTLPLYKPRNLPWDSPLRLSKEIVFTGQDVILKGIGLQSIKAVGDVLLQPPGTSEFARVFHSWESTALRLKDKQFEATIIEAFAGTIRAEGTESAEIYPKGGMSFYSADFAIWYEKFGTGVLQSVDPLFFREHAAVRRWFGIAKSSQSDLYKPEGYFSKAVENVCIGRRFFITHQGSMGLAPPNARPGDEIVFLCGGNYPFVLRGQRDDVGGGLDGMLYQMLGDCYLFGLYERGLAEKNSPPVDFRIR